SRRYAAIRTEVGDLLESPANLQRMLEQNPINAWVGGQGTGGTAYFTYDGQRFATAPNLQVPAHLREAAQDLVSEIVEWRLAAYLRRTLVQTASRIVCKVSH